MLGCAILTEPLDFVWLHLALSLRLAGFASPLNHLFSLLFPILLCPSCAFVLHRWCIDYAVHPAPALFTARSKWRINGLQPLIKRLAYGALIHIERH
jgi:hypothetical protein